MFIPKGFLAEMSETNNRKESEKIYLTYLSLPASDLAQPSVRNVKVVGAPPSDTHPSFQSPTTLHSLWPPAFSF